MNLTKWLSKCEGSLLEGKDKNTILWCWWWWGAEIKTYNGKKQDGRTQGHKKEWKMVQIRKEKDEEMKKAYGK